MMMTDMAPLRGTLLFYCYVPGHKVLLQKDESEYDPYIIISDDTFQYVYHELDYHRCALKSECIQYAIWKTNKPLAEYPEWLIEAYDNGYIYEEDPYGFFFSYNSSYNGREDILIDDGDVILRNYKGELTCMTWAQFDRYYDVMIF